MILRNAAIPGVFKIRQVVQGVVYSPGTSTVANNYGVRDGTGTNRCGWRTMCNLQDPRLVYNAAESLTSVNTGASAYYADRWLRCVSSKTLLTLFNRSASKIRVDLIFLRNKTASTYTSGTNSIAFNLNNSYPSAGDFLVPGWDLPLYYLLANRVSQQVLSSTSPYPPADPTVNSALWFDKDRVVGECDGIRDQFRVLGVRRLMLRPQQTWRKLYSVWNDKRVGLADYYLQTANPVRDGLIQVASRRVDHMSGDVLVFAKVYSNQLAADQQTTYNVQALGYAASEVTFEASQTMTVSRDILQASDDNWLIRAAGVRQGYTNGIASNTVAVDYRADYNTSAGAFTTFNQPI